MDHKIKELITNFLWKRDRLFDKNACEAILDICKESNVAKVESVENKCKSKWRPLPLDTVVSILVILMIIFSIHIFEELKIQKTFNEPYNIWMFSISEKLYCHKKENK